MVDNAVKDEERKRSQFKSDTEGEAYAIVILKGSTILGSMPWAGDLSSAIEHARDRFAMHRSQSGATEVVVLDNDESPKKVVFSYSEAAE